MQQKVPPTGPAASPTYRRAITYAISDGTPACSLRVALVVGTVLNLINQSDAFLTGAPLVWWKIALTYAVPYCVSTYGAVTARLRAETRR